MPRSFIAYLAASADGFIAREDGDVSWLDRPQPRDGYQLAAFLRRIDTVIWGRETWDFAKKHGGTAMFPNVRHLVMSRRLALGADGDVEIVRGPARALAAKLRRQRGKDVWLMGGAELFASFLDVGAVDELVVHVMPVLLGRGIPIFAPKHRAVPLALAGVRRWPDGVVRLHWKLAAKGRR